MPGLGALNPSAGGSAEITWNRASPGIAAQIRNCFPLCCRVARLPSTATLAEVTIAQRTTAPGFKPAKSSCIQTCRLGRI